MREKAYILNQQIKTIANDFRKKFQSDITYSDLLKSLKKLENRSCEYENTSFLILVVGPVKSGKSTFVNLLAKSYVSPTNFLECTIRPSLISSTDGAKEITLYRTHNREQMGEQMENILDCINGIATDDNIVDVTTETIELTPENSKDIIDKHVALELSMVAKDPIIMTSIKTEGGGLLQDGVFLIDMPGFDGDNANIDSLSTYQKIAERADLIVFVQSSNSALSKTSSQFLKLIRELNSSAPVCLIHNVFDAAHWREDEIKSNTIISQKNYAVDRIRSNYKLSISDDNAYNINLGKVSDLWNNNYRNAERKALEREEHYFEEVEKKMYSLVKSQREMIRISNCISRTQIQNVELIKLLEKQIAEHQDIIGRYETATRQLEILKRKGTEMNFNLSVSIDSNELFRIFEEQYNIANHRIADRGWWNSSYTTIFVREMISNYIEAVTQKSNEYFKKCLDKLNNEEVRTQISSWTRAIEEVIENYGIYENITITVDVPKIDVPFEHELDVEELVRKNKFFNHTGNDVRDFLKKAYDFLCGRLVIKKTVKVDGKKTVVEEEKLVRSSIEKQLYPEMQRLAEEMKNQYNRKLVDEGNLIIDRLTKKVQRNICPDIEYIRRMKTELESFKERLSLLQQIEI